MWNGKNVIFYILCATCVLIIAYCIRIYMSRQVYGQSDRYDVYVSSDKNGISTINILDKQDNNVFITDGYMGSGFHLDKYLRGVYWSNNQQDFFVEDARGTLDAYIYDGYLWNGPYRIIKTIENEDEEKYWIVSISYGHTNKRIVADYISGYENQNIPSLIMNKIYKDDGYVLLNE